MLRVAYVKPPSERARSGGAKISRPREYARNLWGLFLWSGFVVFIVVRYDIVFGSKNTVNPKIEVSRGEKCNVIITSHPKRTN